jgi:hypothetical protein
MALVHAFGMNVIASGKSVDCTVKHKVPLTRQETLGQIPSDIFLPGAQTPALDSLAHNRPVLYDQPLTSADGAPLTMEVSTRIESRVTSPVVGGLIGGFCGGVTGFIAGGFVAMFTGNGAFLLGGGALGTAAGGGLGVLSTVGDRVRVVEKELPIEKRAMTGVDVSVTAGRLDGETGYFHRFEPRLERKVIGSYTQPVLERYRA